MRFSPKWSKPGLFANSASDGRAERHVNRHGARAQRLAQTSALARQALRVCASVYRDLNFAAPDALTPDAVERDLVFVGLTLLDTVILKCHASTFGVPATE